jgi:adenosylcobinamide-GDP ribazoletransferase
MVLVGATHPGPAAVASLAVLAILSGALHLDGLADTADALAAPAGAADRARTDPRAGTAGVVAVVLILLLDAALLAELASLAGWLAAAALVVAVSASRTAAVVAGLAAGPARARGKLGSWFVGRLRTGDGVVAIGTTAVAAAGAAWLAGSAIVVGLLIGGAVAVAAGATAVRLRRQLDGDGFGALIELTMTAVLAGCLAAHAIAG